MRSNIRETKLKLQLGFVLGIMLFYLSYLCDVYTKYF